LGFLKAGPRDVVEIHTQALKEKNSKCEFGENSSLCGGGAADGFGIDGIFDFILSKIFYRIE
jgi:hypothetical protein